jgi:hypothetical protein
MKTKAIEIMNMIFLTMRGIFSISLMVFSSLGLFANDNDKPKPASVKVDRFVDRAFRTMYPMASDVVWAKQKNYYVAEFHIEDIEVRAWYDQLGVHYMSMTNMPYAQLPEDIKVTFSSGEYESWDVDEVSLIERKGKDPLYTVAVASDDQKYNLCYSSTGSLMKVIVNTTNALLSLLEIEKEADKPVEVYAYTIDMVVGVGK